ncbi:TetR family transcriptional regulator [Actinoplanes sp. N902-109]|uniref:TetR family transcriptional regulator n=1 Tax=Actinoplanes sp. (strain N902-109) TaxID=649831 RepID=UPI0003293FB7|nr:TetR family transcriptional regulator [Actinoplanes sp. N902-109]AGL19862.1 TetR family transcriptional regulator [Actinoplanes sp. N902-109]
MPRSGAEARRRLQQAALDLYRERGFDQTTAADIAARAGVNERTFFRHFPDKREVLFDGEDELRAALAQHVAASGERFPYDILLDAFRKSARILEDNRPYAEPRLALIAATPALRERDLAKAAAMADALAEALRLRGVPAQLAALAAQTGWATFHHAAQRWIDDPAQGLDAHLVQAFDDVRSLSGRP